MASVRDERAGDVDAIHALHVACFPGDGEARLVDALRASGRLVVSLVADVAGEGVIGHVAFSPVRLDGAPPDAHAPGVGLAPVGVAEAWRGRGIAAGLIRAGLAHCAERGYGWCVVLGEPAYYARFGFQPASRLGLRDEYGGGDAFQAMGLDDNEPPHGGGLVRYAPEFGALDG